MDREFALCNNVDDGKFGPRTRDTRTRACIKTARALSEEFTRDDHNEGIRAGGDDAIDTMNYIAYLIVQYPFMTFAFMLIVYESDLITIVWKKCVTNDHKQNERKQQECIYVWQSRSF